MKQCLFECFNTIKNAMEETNNITHKEDVNIYKLKKLHELKGKVWMAESKKT